MNGVPFHVSVATTVPNPSRTSGSSFEDLGVPSVLTAVLARRGITNPLPIQARALPDALAGRDVLGRAETGSGKTLAFGLPLLLRVAAQAGRSAAQAGGGRAAQPGGRSAAEAGGGRAGRSSRTRPSALVLVPTRELARQVHDELVPLARALGLRMLAVYGGASMRTQVQALRRGVDVVVATPGRLTDLLGQGACSLDAVGITVLDEADHMADMGFLPAVTWLLDRVPSAGQRLLFSATLDNGVDVLVRRYLTDPVHHAVGPAVGGVARTDHRFVEVTALDKVAVAVELAASSGRVLLFVRTRHGAARLARQLGRAGIAAGALHGDMAQHARERALAAFATGRTPVLVATDVAARGIHVEGVDLVMQFDPPAEAKAYLHRSGRTARAGAAGSVVTLVLPEQAADVAELRRRAGVAGAGRAGSAAGRPGGAVRRRRPRHRARGPR
jgi:superfamily II DNA/RNA helicase